MPVVTGGSSQTPAPRAFSTLKTDVARYVLLPNDTDALTVAADAINDAIHRLNTEIWQWNMTYQDISLSADTAEYSLSAAFKAPRHAHFLDVSGNYRASLDYWGPKSFDLEFPSITASGDPQGYTVYNHLDTGNITLTPAPSSAFVASYPTLRMRYYARTQKLANAADVLAVPAEVEPFILWQAKAYMAATYDPSKIGYAQGQAEQLFRALKRDNVKSQTTDWNEVYW